MRWEVYGHLAGFSRSDICLARGKFVVSEDRL